jgi:hypothetical protein
LRVSTKWDMKSKCQLAGMTYAESTRVWRASRASARDIFCCGGKETVLCNSLGVPVECKALFVCCKKLTKRNVAAEGSLRTKEHK